MAAKGKSGRKAAKDKDGAGDGDQEESRTIQPTNLSALRKELKPFLDEMDEKKDDQEKVNGEFMVDIGNIKERYANKTGYTRAQLSEVYGDHRRELNRERKRKEREEKENDALDTLRAALEGIRGTPLYRAAMARAGASSEEAEGATAH